MSHTFSNNYKVHYREYLRHKGEPRDNGLYEAEETEDGAELIKSSYHERRRLRRTAKRLKQYS